MDAQSPSCNSEPMCTRVGALVRLDGCKESANTGAEEVDDQEAAEMLASLAGCGGHSDSLKKSASTSEVEDKQTPLKHFSVQPTSDAHVYPKIDDSRDRSGGQIAALSHYGNDSNARQSGSDPIFFPLCLQGTRPMLSRHVDGTVVARNIMCSWDPRGVRPSQQNTVNAPPPNTKGREREVRLIGNRNAAKRFRDRKKQYIQLLETKKARLEDDNQKLVKELKYLLEQES